MRTVPNARVETINGHKLSKTECHHPYSVTKMSRVQ